MEKYMLGQDFVDQESMNTFATKYRRILILLFSWSQQIYVFHQNLWINKKISMQGFKGLIPKNLLADQAITPLVKKADEYRKVENNAVDLVLSISKPFEIHGPQAIKLVGDLEEMNKNISCPYYAALDGLYIDIQEVSKNFYQSFVCTSSSELTLSVSTRYVDFSACILNFQQMLKNYSSTEIQAGESAKKYFKTLKNLTAGIEAYKVSFQGAKLIYNIDEKVKRYSNCQNIYRGLEQEFSSITDFRDKLDSKKKELIELYTQIEDQLETNQIELNVKMYNFFKKFNSNLWSCMGEKSKIIIKNKQILEEKDSLACFHKQIQIEFHEDLEAEIPSNSSNHSKKGSLIDFFHNIEILIDQDKISAEVLIEKMKHLEYYGEEIKQEHRRFYDFHYQFYRSIEKIFLPSLKETSIFLEKSLKKSKELFFKSSYYALKNTNNLLKVVVNGYEILFRKINPKFSTSLKILAQLNEIIKLAITQIHSHFQKVLQHRDQASFKSQLRDKLIFVQHLLTGFNEKSSKSTYMLRKTYNDITHDYGLCLEELELLCSEYVTKNEEEHKKNVIDMKSQKIQRLKNTPLTELTKPTLQKSISFDGDNGKMDDFKKLKRPADIQIVQKSKEQRSSPQETIRQQTMQDQMDERNQGERMLSGMADSLVDGAENLKDKKKKNKLFLQSKITFIEGEDIVKTVSCALADKIILQGKMYITSHRLCFSSKFNSDNVFFGGTFIQIPLKDIITLQKRKNGIFFDNSISLITKNGQIFFTSFLKRNQAFDLITSLADINPEHNIYMAQSEGEDDSSASIAKKNPLMFDTEYQQEHQEELKQQEIPQRAKQIEEMTKQDFPYANLTEFSYNDQNLTAFKFLHHFIFSSEMTIQRKKYPNWNEYFKKYHLGHKDIECGPFQPPISENILPNNIKSSMPLKISRTLSSTIPMGNSGIPFMPKWAKTFQTQNLYIISKHKWIILSVFDTTGAPYTDCFRVNLRTACESNGKGCNLDIKIHLEFIKSTMMKGIIESKSHQESRLQLKKQFDQYRKYLIELQKRKHKTSIGESPTKLTCSGMNNSQTIQAAAMMAEYQEKIVELEEKYDKVFKEKEQLNQKLQNVMKKMKLGFGVILVVYLLTFGLLSIS